MRGPTIRSDLTKNSKSEEKRNPKRSKIRIESNYETVPLEMKMKRMAQSGFGLWKILAILMVIVTIGSCAALTSAVDVVSESNRNTSPATSYMPDNYSLIRVAVDNASFGDMIVVYNETYEENVTVNRLGALAVQMNNFTDSRTSVSEWETAKIITFLSTDTDSIQLISVTPPAGTTLQRGTVVPFEVTVDYNLESVATGFVGAELGLSDGRCVCIGDRVEVTQGHGTAVIRGSVDVDHLYDWLHSDTAYLALSLGYKKDPTHSILLIWKHMPDQCYFIAGAPPQPIASFDYSWATFPESPKSGEVILTFANSKNLYKYSFFMKRYISVFCKNTRYRTSFTFLLRPNPID